VEVPQLGFGRVLAVALVVDAERREHVLPNRSLDAQHLDFDLRRGGFGGSGD
jgi:hypothetical protein